MKRIYSLQICLILLTISHCCLSQPEEYTETEITIINEGWELKGDLLLVKSKTKTPVVLMLNKANGDRKPYAAIARLLAQRSISSLRLDLRGHGQSINKGKFIPFDSINNAKINLDKTYTDITAAYKFLLSLKDADTNKIGVIGASYSAEDMMISARKFKYAKSYIALSPGSFSDESITSIDSCQTTTLFIKSIDERSMQGFEKNVFVKSKKAQILIVAGNVHATDIISPYPEISALIADWLKNHLR